MKSLLVLYLVILEFWILSGVKFLNFFFRIEFLRVGLIFGSFLLCSVKGVVLNIFVERIIREEEIFISIFFGRG